jgi:ribosomal protein S18 acetylase RimI-like enzyme
MPVPKCGKLCTMSAPKYLIDTKVFIGLEDQSEVSPTLSSLLQLAARHGVGVFVHAAAVDDIARDKNAERRRISLSKIKKFQIVAKVRGLDLRTLEAQFGTLRKANDIVDATLLHSLQLGVADFVITEDRGLHERARRYAPALANQVLYVADAVSLLRFTYEPIEVPLCYVEEVEANSIPQTDQIFVGLRNDYAGFDTWWRNKCVRPMRKCWIVVDNNELAGLVVRKAESPTDTDAKLPGTRILKICTFKVRPEHRGIKLGELLLKQILWFAQLNQYEVVYLTTFPRQSTLIDLLVYYGFRQTYIKPDGELVYEKAMGVEALSLASDVSSFDLARLNYPRFHLGPDVRTYTIPIKEAYHDVLFPELADRSQLALFGKSKPITPGNTIRKVYLSRAPARMEHPGAIIIFYKGKSKMRPSQAVTTVGIFEDMTLASSTEELRRLAGGRSVYSDVQLREFNASSTHPVKVINFLLVGHIEPPLTLQELQQAKVLSAPPRSIVNLDVARMRKVLAHAQLGFEV